MKEAEIYCVIKSFSGKTYFIVTLIIRSFLQLSNRIQYLNASKTAITHNLFQAPMKENNNKKKNTEVKMSPGSTLWQAL